MYNMFGRTFSLFIPSILLASISFRVQAQDILTKEEVLRIALEQNFNIRIVNNTERIAENNTSILNSGYLPQLNAVVGAEYQSADDTRSFPGVTNPETGIPRPDIVITGAETQRYNAGLTASYVLFDGLGRRYRYKQLYEQYQLTKLQARETIENTWIQLCTIYYDIARLVENRNVVKDILETSQQRVLRAKYRFEYGQDTKLAVLNAEVDAVNDSITLMTVNQQLENTKRDLNAVLGRNAEQEFSVDTIVQLLPGGELLKFQDSIDTNNVVILQARQGKRITAFDEKIARSGYLPQLSLNGFYGWNQVRSPASAFFPGNISDSQTLTAGVTLNWSLFDGGPRYIRIRNAQLAQDNDQLRIEQAELEVRKDVVNAWGTYQNQLRIYTIREQNVQTAQNNFERSEERLKLGQISSVEFRQAQVNLLNAQTDKNIAKYDAKLAEIRYLQLTGQLLNVAF